MLLIYSDEQAWTEAEREHCFAESTQLAHRRVADGQYLPTAPLQSVSTATSVQVRDGKRILTDGPFAETREQLGGYFLIDARNLDEAIGIAARISRRAQGYRRNSAGAGDRRPARAARVRRRIHRAALVRERWPVDC